MILIVPTVSEEITARGFAMVEGVLSPSRVEHLLTSLEHIGDTGSVRKRGGITPFLYGHSLHAYWEKVGKYLVIVAMGELL